MGLGPLSRGGAEKSGRRRQYAERLHRPIHAILLSQPGALPPGDRVSPDLDHGCRHRTSGRHSTACACRIGPPSERLPAQAASLLALTPPSWLDRRLRPRPCPVFLVSRISLDPVVAGLDLRARALSPIVFSILALDASPPFPRGVRPLLSTNKALWKLTSPAVCCRRQMNGEIEAQKAHIPRRVLRICHLWKRESHYSQLT